MITDQQREQLNHWFVYHKPTPEQLTALDKINNAALELAKIIMEVSPTCADQSAALRLVREAKMTAAAAVTMPATTTNSKPQAPPEQAAKAS